MIKNESCLRIIVSAYGFEEHYKENRLVVNGISELDSMIITENYDCSKILCIRIDEPIPKTQIELAIHRFADKLNNAGAIGAYNVHPMGIPLDSSGVRFHDVYSNDNTVKQFRYVIDYVSVMNVREHNDIIKTFCDQVVLLSSHVDTLVAKPQNVLLCQMEY